MDFKEIHFIANYWILLLPCIFMACDIVSGYLKAVYHKKFESSIMRKGLMHKAGELIVLILFIVSQYSLGLPSYICTFIAIYIVLMEAYSICENLDDIGVKIPTFIKNSLKEETDKMDKGDKDEDK